MSTLQLLVFLETFSGNLCTIRHHFQIFGTWGQMESLQYLNLMFCLAQPHVNGLLTNLSKIFKQLQLIFVIVWSFTIMIQNNILKWHKIIITTRSSYSSDVRKGTVKVLKPRDLKFYKRSKLEKEIKNNTLYNYFVCFWFAMRCHAVA